MSSTRILKYLGSSQALNLPTKQAFNSLKLQIGQIEKCFIADWDNLVDTIFVQLQTESVNSDMKNGDQLQKHINGVIYYSMHIEQELQRLTSSQNKLCLSINQFQEMPVLFTDIFQKLACLEMCKTFWQSWEPVIERSMELYYKFRKLKQSTHSFAKLTPLANFFSLLLRYYYAQANETYFPLILANISQYRAGLDRLSDHFESLHQGSHNHKPLVALEEEYALVRYHL
jgi:hypothetical protein